MFRKPLHQQHVIPAKPTARAGISSCASNNLMRSRKKTCGRIEPLRVSLCIPSPPAPGNQQGFSLVTAIFIIVILALLAIGMLQLLSTSQQSVSQEVTSVKSYFAGQSGLQWGMYQATYAGATGSHTLTLSNAGLTNTSVDITLSSDTILANTYYTVNTKAKYGTTAIPEYAYRELELRFKP